MTIIDIALPVLHPKQDYMDAHSRRFNVARCGRRFGKDVWMERRIIRRTASVKFQAFFAPSYRMMTENFQSIRNRLSPIVTRATESLHRLELVNGAVLEFWSMDNVDAARGHKYGWVTINEAAQALKGREAWDFVIRPTLADLAGGADIGGTPRGLNWFYELERDNKDSPDWAMFHYTTYDNAVSKGGHIPDAEIDAMAASLPDRVVKQEILAEYVEDGAFFANVDEVCIIQQPDSPDNHKGHRIVAGLDWALTTDFTRLRVLCATCSRVVDWWGGNKMDYSMQRGLIAGVLSKWETVVLLPERNSMGAPNIEELSKTITIGRGPDGGRGFNTTSASKAELIMSLALACQKKEVALPAEDADEMRSYEVEMTAINPKFNAPPGQHDDRVIADALAWWAAKNQSWWMS